MSQLDCVVEIFHELRIGASEIRGLAIVEEPPFLRHFTSRLRQL